MSQPKVEIPLEIKDDTDGVRFHSERFQFRWLKIKGLYASFPISITLFSNHLK